MAEGWDGKEVVLASDYEALKRMLEPGLHAHINSLNTRISELEADRALLLEIRNVADAFYEEHPDPVPSARLLCKLGDALDAYDNRERNKKG